MKASNNLEREILKKEERMAKSFKFTKMSKRVPFLPSLHQKGNLQDGVTSIDDRTDYRDGREIEALIFPSKVNEKSKKFNLVRTQTTGFIDRAVGQECDAYDYELVKYYNNPERGTLKPIRTASGATMKADPTTKHIGTTKGVWRSNSFSLNPLNKFKPMLARELTPRGALRATTLERNFAREKWLYNKSQLEELDPSKSKIDVDRSKSLRKLARRQERQRTIKEAALERNKTFYSTMSGSELMRSRGVKSPGVRSVKIDETVSTAM